MRVGRLGGFVLDNELALLGALLSFAVLARRFIREGLFTGFEGVGGTVDGRCNVVLLSKLSYFMVFMDISDTADMGVPSSKFGGKTPFSTLWRLNMLRIPPLDSCLLSLRGTRICSGPFGTSIGGGRARRFSVKDDCGILSRSNPSIPPGSPLTESAIVCAVLRRSELIGSLSSVRFVWIFGTSI